MRCGRAAALGIWLLAVGIGALVVARARFSADLSGFLPRAPTPVQRLLADQLQNGLAAHLILIGIEGGDGSERARAAQALAARLRAQSEFIRVDDGASGLQQRDRSFLFEHRYLLSDAVTPERFSAQGLRAAMSASLELIDSPAGGLAASLLEADPTGETLQILDRFDAGGAPQRQQGVWSSPDGRRALLLAETRASGADTDGQAAALAAIRAAFAAASPPASALRLVLSGPAVFSVEARDTIRREVRRLSLLSSVLIVALLLAVYRSVGLLLLGLLPVLSGALAGIAAVALGAGIVHGITLGFGITLIGESVDYPIYLLVQSRRTRPGARTPEPPARLWRTLGLGVLTSICGFASLLPSSFPGLSQLGLFSVCGLAVAAAVTRLLLPRLLPDESRLRDLSALGESARRLLARTRDLGLVAACLGLIAAGVLIAHRATLWNRDLAALSPVTAAAQALDAQLRRDLHAPDVSNLVLVSGADQEAVLERAEAVAPALDGLVARGLIGGYDTPAHYLPSRRAQAARRANLPDAATLRARVREATASLPLRPEALEPFVQAVERAREAAPVERAGLAQTSLGLALDALLWRHADRWYGLLPLRAAAGEPQAAEIDIEGVRAALGTQPADTAAALNIRQETDALYAGYLAEAARLSLWGLGAIVLLLALALRSARRVLRVLAPLLLAVLIVAAALNLSGVPLTILHLIGLLLIVAVGSNYALFFDPGPAGAVAGERGELPRTLASLLLANACTVIAFSVLASAQVPVLRDLGSTVAPGALLALWLSAWLAPRELLQAAAAPARTP